VADLFEGLGERAELGTLLRPWTTPPFEASEDRLRRVTVEGLSSSAVAGKIGALTQGFVDRFGYAPRSHRASGAGLDGAAVQTLERLGYRVDSSVTPFLDHRAAGGSDWRMAPEVPYFPDRQRPHLRGASPILEVPLTVGWDAPMPDVLARGLTRAPDAVRRWVKRGVSLRALDPWAADVEVLRGLSRVLIDRGLPVINLSLDSWALTAETCGRPPARCKAVLGALEELLRYLVDQLRLTPRTLTNFADWYLNETATQ
ncbi:MAG: hypothetical protein ACI9U2_003714, partial [Bradymonadia bacterium]